MRRRLFTTVEVDTLVELLFAELIDEVLPAGELLRIVKSVRVSGAEHDESHSWKLIRDAAHELTELLFTVGDDDESEQPPSSS